MTEMICTRCGAAVEEQVSVQLLQCPYCGTRFSTPEHDQRFRDYMTHRMHADRMELERRQHSAAVDSEARGWVSGLVLILATFFAGMLGRVVRFALGVFVTLAAVPLVCRFGVLREIYPEVHAIALRLPFVGGHYPPPQAGFDGGLPPQLLAAALLGLGLTLIKLKPRGR